MARDGLKQGLLLQLLGNATDTHNANAGDAEEWDYPGAAANLSLLLAHVCLVDGQIASRAIERNPGPSCRLGRGDAEAIFAAMQRKEVYATSGTQIALRFFGGFNNMQPNDSSARGR